MRIAVNTRLLIDGKLEGIGWFSFESFKRITESHPEHEFIFFFDRTPSSKFIFGDNVKAVVLHPQARHPLLWKVWFDWSIKRALKKYEVDVFVSPDGFLCLKTQVPQLAVIHDLNFEHFPKGLRKSHANYYRNFFPKFASKAEKVVTVSKASKKDICDLYGLPESKVDVVYNGVNNNYHPISENDIASNREVLSAGENYFIYVGSLHFRKNIERMMEAFDDFKVRSSAKTKLLIVGEKMWGNKSVETVHENMKHKDDVVFCGRMAPVDLHKAIASSLAMVYVPIFEGFGIPILEGFSCGVPVLTSNVSSMPEVAGDAAMLVDPLSVSSISDGMLAIEKDAGIRTILVKNGSERVKDFSWDKTAEQLWSAIERLNKGSDA